MENSRLYLPAAFSRITPPVAPLNQVCARFTPDPDAISRQRHNSILETRSLRGYESRGGSRGSMTNYRSGSERLSRIDSREDSSQPFTTQQFAVPAKRPQEQIVYQRQESAPNNSNREVQDNGRNRRAFTPDRQMQSQNVHQQRVQENTSSSINQEVQDNGRNRGAFTPDRQIQSQTVHQQRVQENTSNSLNREVQANGQNRGAFTPDRQIQQTNANERKNQPSRREVSANKHIASDSQSSSSSILSCSDSETAIPTAAFNNHCFDTEKSVHKVQQRAAFSPSRAQQVRVFTPNKASTPNSAQQVRASTPNKAFNRTMAYSPNRASFATQNAQHFAPNVILIENSKPSSSLSGGQPVRQQRYCVTDKSTGINQSSKDDESQKHIQASYVNVPKATYASEPRPQEVLIPRNLGSEHTQVVQYKIRENGDIQIFNKNTNAHSHRQRRQHDTASTSNRIENCNDMEMAKWKRLYEEMRIKADAGEFLKNKAQTKLAEMESRLLRATATEIEKESIERQNTELKLELKHTKSELLTWKRLYEEKVQEADESACEENKSLTNAVTSSKIKHEAYECDGNAIQMELDELRSQNELMKEELRKEKARYDGEISEMKSSFHFPTTRSVAIQTQPLILMPDWSRPDPNTSPARSDSSGEPFQSGALRNGIYRMTESPGSSSQGIGIRSRDEVVLVSDDDENSPKYTRKRAANNGLAAAKKKKKNGDVL
ncbi:hypothetical protein Ddc_03604 [Ditylenchus destructor]|nr:hypothetical protein Ddc_03604 [Ditylenchus destructor]